MEGLMVHGQAVQNQVVVALALLDLLLQIFQLIQDKELMDILQIFLDQHNITL
jgi:hypothetical protein